MADASTVDPVTAGQRDVSISLGKANLYALPLMIVAVVVIFLAYASVWSMGELRDAVVDFTSPVVFIPSFLLGIVAHEGLHALGWHLFAGKPWSSFSFGIHAFTPYAHCKEPMCIGGYRWGTGLPGVLLGVFPVVAGMATGWGAVMVFGTVFVSAAGGDALVLWILRSVPANALAIDHPTRAGCMISLPPS